jgi:hypothetical protein
MVAGYGRLESTRIGQGSVNHAWNAVFLNNQWHLCDPTWASGYVNSGRTEFTRKFNENYFLTNPGLFITQHYPTNSSWTLLTNKPSLKQFLSAPHRSDGFIANKLNHYTPELGRLKVKLDSLIRFSFTSNLPVNSLNEASIYVHKKIGKDYKFHDQKDFNLSVNKEGYYYFDYSLLEKGEFRIRIFIKNRLAFTYEVNSK